VYGWCNMQVLHAYVEALLNLAIGPFHVLPYLVSN
jgi:hypothetical protein